MVISEWQYGPFGLDAVNGRTFPVQRTVLVVVHSVTAGTRLADVWPLVESDLRIQLVFTRPPDALMARGADQFLSALGGVVLPWQQAVQQRFDLAIAASTGHLDRVHAPVLGLSHGIGFSKLGVRYAGFGPEASLDVAGLERAGLIAHGRVIPSAIVVPTKQALKMLADAVPEAASAAVVGGDPCYDRLAASAHLRQVYRKALGAGRRKLVVVSSTWGAGSLLEEHPDILSRLARELPEDYCLTAAVHPNAWSWHGRRQVRAWCAEAMRAGLLLVPPEEGWRALLVAGDWLIGDHGSVTCYAAASGLPVLLGVTPAGHIAPGSPVTCLARTAPLLAREPLLPQLASASTAWTAERHALMRARLTDAPGQAARIIRRVMYGLMNLSEPENHAKVPPVPAPAVMRGS